MAVLLFYLLIKEAHMTQLLGISGSLRAGSFNTQLLHAAQKVTPAPVTLDIATLHGIPLYDGDLEAREGLPAAVIALREQIQASAGVVLCTPEYNNGVPGVFKNAIDWLSRVSDAYPSVFKNKPLTLMGASPGGFGTILSQAHWLPVLRTLDVQLWPNGHLMVSRAHTVLQNGELTDEALLQQLTAFMTGFTQFVQSR